MIINHNMASLNTYNKLNANTTNTARSLEKLSSGLRINKAGDDAAGLAISEKMRGQIRGLDQASRNAQDGISLIQTAEGSLSETQSILQRMKELATQAANDTNVTGDRTEIQKEMNQLSSEINRIGNTTEFNTQKLLKGTSVAVVETAAANTVVQEGVTGVPVGDVTGITVNASSVQAVASTASVQASTTKATGAVSEMTVTTESIQGTKASVNVGNGIVFESAELTDNLNTKTVEIRQADSGNNVESSLAIDGDNNFVFTIGTDANGDSKATDRASLYNELSSSLDNFSWGSQDQIVVKEPSNSAELLSTIEVAPRAMSGGLDETTGEYSFGISTAIKEAGDTVTVNGQTFTAVYSGADATKGEFNVGAMEAKLSAGGAHVAATDLAADVVNADAQVDIVLGGTTYSLDKTALDTFTGGAFTESDVIALVGAATDGSAALSTVADVTFDSGKLVITAKTPQTTPVTWTASSSTAEDVGTINDAFGMNTKAEITGGAVVDTTQNAAGVAAEWDSGAVTALPDAATQTYIFNGVTVTVAGTGVAAAAVTGAKAVTIGVAVAGVTAAQTATAVLAGIAAYKANTTGTMDADGSLDDFTFGGDETGITITDTVANGDAHNALVTSGTIVTVATAATVAGVDALDADTSVTIAIDGKDYNLTSSQIGAVVDGAYTEANIRDLLKTATDADGNLLSTVADISLDTTGSNTLIIASKSLGIDSSNSVRFTINDGSAGSVDTVTLETLFGDMNTLNDTGADAISDSRSTTDQTKSLATAINANTTFSTRFDTLNDSNVSSGTITFTEKTDCATGVDLTDPSIAGGGTDDKLVITNNGGQNFNTVTLVRADADVTAVSSAVTVKSEGVDLTVTATGLGARGNGVQVALEQNSEDSLNVAFNDGVITIKLADTTGASNSLANIQTALRALTSDDGLDFSTWTVSGAAWDAAAVTGDSITTSSSGSLSGGVDAITKKALDYSVSEGNLTISLGDTAKENTAAKIQEMVQDIGEYGYFNGDSEWTVIDFSQYEFSGQGNWDTATVGTSITKTPGTLAGGTLEVKGDYSFSIEDAFVAGDIVQINDQVFTAVESGAIASKGEFNVEAGDITLQADSLRDAMGLNTTLNARFGISGTGGEINMKETAATGSDLTDENLEVRATGTVGEYSIAAPEVLANGAKFVLDGQEILVSNKNEHVGYADGTAIKEAASAVDQTAALAAAINTNATLSVNYTASVGDDGSLVLNQNIGSSTAPTASTMSSDKGNFSSTFQVGANSGQSMKIDVEDMRSAALGVTGDGSAATVKASNGSTASYVSTANVTDGTTDTNSEFALDVSTHDKATAAIGVLDDALAAVSAQRSQLGAFQNRLEHTITNLGTSSENLTGAESRIRDVDMAKEMMQFQKNNILAQAATAMLAQANQQPQGVLQLLR